MRKCIHRFINKDTSQCVICGKFPTNPPKPKQQPKEEDKIKFIMKRLDKDGDITVCSECGELMVAPLGFDIYPVCSKIDCNYKFFKNNN